MARSAGRTDEMLTIALRAALRGERVRIVCTSEAEARRVFALAVRKVRKAGWPKAT